MIYCTIFLAERSYYHCPFGSFHSLLGCHTTAYTLLNCNNFVLRYNRRHLKMPRVHTFWKAWDLHSLEVNKVLGVWALGPEFWARHPNNTEHKLYIWNPSAGRKKQKCPWGELASHSTGKFKPWDHKRPYHKNYGGQWLRKTVLLSATPLTCIYSYRHIHS